MTDLVLYMLSTRQQVQLDLQGKTILGRDAGIDNDGILCIDLSPHRAYSLGVSRRHVLLAPEDDQLVVYDLGSRNGTYLNGKKLVPQQGYPIHDQDELMLGSLEIRIYVSSAVPYTYSQIQPDYSVESMQPDLRETVDIATLKEALSLEEDSIFFF